MFEYLNEIVNTVGRSFLTASHDGTATASSKHYSYHFTTNSDGKILDSNDQDDFRDTGQNICPLQQQPKLDKKN